MRSMTYEEDAERPKSAFPRGAWEQGGRTLLSRSERRHSTQERGNKADPGQFRSGWGIGGVNFSESSHGLAASP